jgi:hypothetical protein
MGYDHPCLKKALQIHQSGAMLRDELQAAHMSPIRDRPLRSHRRAVVFPKSDFR